jgi:putative ABC transport system substrate-binding protein
MRRRTFAAGNVGPFIGVEATVPLGRRELMMLLCGAAISSLPCIAMAQRSTGPPRIAVLDWESSASDRLAPFRKAMRDLGYTESQNISIEYFYAEGRTDRAEALAAEIAKRPVNVIVAFATPAAHAVKKATSTIPIVVATADPVGTGLVSNLARPGGNITGVSNMMPDLESKRLELLRELLPGLKQVAFLGSTRDPAATGFVREAQAAANRLGVQLRPVLIGSPEEIDGALGRMVRDDVEAVIVQPLFALNTSSAARLAQLAALHRLPAITNYAHFPQSGGLMSYGPRADFSRRAAAEYVDRILKGAIPGDLPVQQPVQFQLAINLKAATSLGLKVPPTLLAIADEVVE